MNNNPFDPTHMSNFDSSHEKSPFTATRSHAGGVGRAILYGLVALTAIVASVYIFGRELMDMSAQKWGWVVTDISVQGAVNIPHSRLEEALGFEQGSPLLAVSLEDAKERLEAINDVKWADVYRHWDGRIEVRIQMRFPFAVIEHEGNSYEITDEEGVTLAWTQDISRYGLPIFRGHFDMQEGVALWKMLMDAPLDDYQVTYLEYVKGRWWRITMHDGMTVTFPEQDIATAWHEMLAMAQQRQEFKRNPSAIDLREYPQVMLDLTGRQLGDMP